MNQLIAISGPALPALVTAAGDRAGVRFLEFFAAMAKPFKVAELNRRIAEILHGSSSELSADGHNSVR
jgi:hypothetical protein